MIQNFKEDYESPIPVVRFYFRKVMSALIEMLGDVQQEVLILDFGCGKQYFKKVSCFKNVIGYDIVPGFSEISDYRALRPDIILCNHALEHLSIDELKETLENFKRMNPKFIITGIPLQKI